MKTKDIAVGNRYGVTTKTRWETSPYYLTEAEVVEIRSSSWDSRTIAVRYPNGRSPEQVICVRPVDVRCTWDKAVELKEQSRVWAEQNAENRRVAEQRRAVADEAWKTTAPALAEALDAAGIGAKVSRWQTGFVTFTPEAAAALAEFISAAVTVEIAA